VVTEYDWNDKNGLVGVAVDDSTVWQATYYPDGKRCCRTNTDGSIYYLYDGGKAIATYDTNWDIRESFGYGLGSRDPIVNTQFYDGQEAYYYVKDGLGNVNMILNADEATAATIALTACGVPDPAGDYDSDIDFGAGGLVWDEDVGAYVRNYNYTDPETRKKMGGSYFIDECGRCVASFGLDAWDFDPEPDPSEDTWPPFVSPLQGYPVMLDAGDAGIVGMTTAGGRGGSEVDNPDGRHSNGIDWVAEAYKSRPVAIADYKMDSVADGEQNPYFEMTKRYSVSASKLPNPADVPNWRKEANGPGMGIRYAGYIHSFRQTPESGVYKQGITQVALTNRLANDANLGPHLHLYLKDDNAWLSDPWGKRFYDDRSEDDAAWQEKYFPALPEIPLHIYLTAVCRYGWMQGTFGSISNDWNLTWGAPASLHCMWTGDGTYTYGDCASRCQGAVARSLLPDDEEKWKSGQKEQACKDAHFDEMFYPTSDPQTEDEHRGCAACCDHRFSEFLLNYFSWASGYGLPMDNLANATPEGYIGDKVIHNGTVFIPAHYQAPWYLHTGSQADAVASMGEQMLTAWQMATDKFGDPNQGYSCAEASQGIGGPPPGHDQGPGWCN